MFTKSSLSDTSSNPASPPNPHFGENKIGLIQLQTFDIRFLKGVGDKISALLNAAGIVSFWDLLTFFPRTYEDRRRMPTFSEICRLAESGESIQGRVILERIVPRFAGGGRKWFEGVGQFLPTGEKFESEKINLSEINSGETSPSRGQKILFTWFHTYGPPLDKKYPPGSILFFRGKGQIFRGSVQCVHPDLQKMDTENPEYEKGIVPIYREIGGISTRVLRRIIFGALNRIEFTSCPDPLPPVFLNKFKFSDWRKCIREIHFPKDWEPEWAEPVPAGKFFDRVVFEELLIVSLALLLRRTLWKTGRWDEGSQSIPPLVEVNPDFLGALTQSLPFKLTSDQEKSLDEVLKDLSLRGGRVSMHRLVQGDVGSGKTIVAFLAALAAIDQGFQVALMAPTEILADQHFQNFSKLFPNKSHLCLLLKGALTAKQKRETRADIFSGQAKLVIGTQALLTADTLFEALGLVIIDEQHRFGVAQRWQLKNRAQKEGLLQPHLLVMSATPIPRSLALTLYGDLEMSVIRQKPAGRQPIETHLVRRRAQTRLEQRLLEFTKENRQIYIVYPLVEESEELDLKDVKSSHAHWSKIFSGCEVGLLHGRMKSKEKEFVMRRFSAGEIQVLVSTTVIEVGVDVPNATVMVIEHAERFGLSQLHQLRGRVGRGSQKSFCILVGPDKLSETAEARLKILVESNDGFVIAEKDLDIRGPGEFLGSRQSGVAGFRIAHLLRDQDLLIKARAEAEEFSKTDPLLKTETGEKLRSLMNLWLRGRALDWTSSG